MLGAKLMQKCGWCVWSSHTEDTAVLARTWREVIEIRKKTFSSFKEPVCVNRSFTEDSVSVATKMVRLLSLL